LFPFGGCGLVACDLPFACCRCGKSHGGCCAAFSDSARRGGRWSSRIGDSACGVFGTDSTRCSAVGAYISGEEQEAAVCGEHESWTPDVSGVMGDWKSRVAYS